jgi:adenylate kinase family enzyme
MHKYIIMGVHGSGKETQAKLLKESLDLVHNPSPDSDPVNYSTAL